MTRTVADITAMLTPHGLILRGGFALEPARDADLLQAWPGARQLLLIGNAGSAIWPYLTDFIRDNPQADHPLDRWTREKVSHVAQQLGVIDLYPFGGPPWWPFQRWAQRGEPVSPSPLGILIHPVFGLWHAYRAALLLEQAIDLPVAAPAASPCDSCEQRPCLSTCPVVAFTPQGYDVAGCAEHVISQRGMSCRTGSCLARLACPVGESWRYEREHAAFHMAAFVDARRTTTKG